MDMINIKEEETDDIEISDTIFVNDGLDCSGSENCEQAMQHNNYNSLSHNEENLLPLGGRIKEEMVS